jgi:hypothetical protein
MRLVNETVIHWFNGKPKAPASEISDAFGLPLNQDTRSARTCYQERTEYPRLDRSRKGPEPLCGPSIMLEIRVTLLLALGCCVAASGCQSEAPASATNGQPAAGQSPANAGPANEASAPASHRAPGGTSTSGEARPPAQVLKPRDDGRPISITFDDLELAMKEDSVFDPGLLTPRVKQLDGQRVRIRGFIYPSVFQQTGITRFPLVKNTECKFGPGGVAHHIIVVEMQPEVSTSFTVRPIAVEGVFAVRPWTGPDGMTWTVYHMVGEKVD